MPTNKDPRPKTVKSRLLALKKAETILAGYKDLLNDSKHRIARAGRLTPGDDVKLRKALQKAKTSAEQTVAAQKSTAAALLPKWEVYNPIDWTRVPDIHLHRCQTMRGISQTRFSILGTPIELPSVSDTEWGYDATIYDSSSGSYQSLMYEHWIVDHTHFYSFDSFDMMWLISHLGYEFPAPQCNGTMNYEANLSMIVTASVSAESGLLSDELLLKEIPDAGANPSAPATFEAYSRSFGQLNFTSTGHRTLDAVATGSFKVAAGKKSRVWFGISGICTALEGYAGTNGNCYLMVKPASGETQPGVKYAFVPD